MRDDETAVVVLTLVCGTALLFGVIGAVTKGRNRRLQILEMALQNGAVDEATKRLLVEELTKPSMIVQLVRVIWSGGKLLVALGWIGLFLGIGIAVAGGYRSEEVGVPFALVSFGILSVPFALRELDSRKAA